MIIDRAYLVELRGSLHVLSSFYPEFSNEEIDILIEFKNAVTEEIKSWDGNIPKETLLAVRELFIELEKKTFFTQFEKLKVCSVICILGKLVNTDKE